MSFKTALINLARMRSGLPFTEEAIAYDSLESGGRGGCETCGPEYWANIVVNVSEPYGEPIPSKFNSRYKRRAENYWSEIYDTPSSLWEDLAEAEEWAKDHPIGVTK